MGGQPPFGCYIISMIIRTTIVIKQRHSHAIYQVVFGKIDRKVKTLALIVQQETLDDTVMNHHRFCFVVPIAYICEEVPDLLYIPTVVT